MSFMPKLCALADLPTTEDESELKMQNRIAAHAFAKDMLSNLVTDVLDREEQRGALISEADVSISEHFLPWLLQKTIDSVAPETESDAAKSQSRWEKLKKMAAATVEYKYRFKFVFTAA